MPPDEANARHQALDRDRCWATASTGRRGRLKTASMAASRQTTTMAKAAGTPNPTADAELAGDDQAADGRAAHPRDLNTVLFQATALLKSWLGTSCGSRAAPRWSAQRQAGRASSSRP